VPNLGKSTGDDVLEEAAGKGERLEGGCVFALGAEGDVVVGEVLLDPVPPNHSE